MDCPVDGCLCRRTWSMEGERAPGRLPVLDDISTLDLGGVVLAYQSDRELRFRVIKTNAYPTYQPFEIVFIYPRSFTGAQDMSDVRFCVRGPSPAGDGVVFEFEARDVQARIVAVRATVEAAPGD